MTLDQIKDLAIKKLQDERTDKEKLRYTKWINSFLAPLSMDVNDLFLDLADGRKLAKLLELLSGQELPKLNHKCTRRIQQIENLNICLSFLKSKIKLDNISAENILDGDRNYILSLLWTIQLKFIGKNKMFETEKGLINTFSNDLKNEEVKYHNYSVTIKEKDENESASSCQSSENLEDNDPQTLGDFKKEKVDRTHISDNLEHSDSQPVGNLSKEKVDSISSQFSDTLEDLVLETIGNLNKEKMDRTSFSSQISDNLEHNAPQALGVLDKEKVNSTSSQVSDNLEDLHTETFGNLNKEKVDSTSSTQFSDNLEDLEHETSRNLNNEKMDRTSPNNLEGSEPYSLGDLNKEKPERASISQSSDNSDFQNLDLEDEVFNKLDLEDEDCQNLDNLQNEKNHDKITQKTMDYNSKSFWYKFITRLLVLGILILLLLLNIE